MCLPFPLHLGNASPPVRLHQYVTKSASLDQLLTRAPVPYASVSVTTNSLNSDMDSGTLICSSAVTHSLTRVVDIQPRLSCRHLNPAVEFGEDAALATSMTGYWIGTSLHTDSNPIVTLATSMIGYWIGTSPSLHSQSVALHHGKPNRSASDIRWPTPRERSSASLSKHTRWLAACVSRR